MYLRVKGGKSVLRLDKREVSSLKQAADICRFLTRAADGFIYDSAHKALAGLSELVVLAERDDGVLRQPGAGDGVEGP